MNLNPETLTCIQLLSSFDTVHSVRIRSKITNNIELLDTECVSFYVTEKKPLSALDTKEIVPTSVTIEGKIYPTDVVQVGYAQTHPFPNGWVHIPSDAQKKGPNHILRNGLILAGCDPCYQEWFCGLIDSMWPAGEHNAIQRPLRGGLQITGNTRLSGYGTLGGIVYDTTDHTTVGITNAHVVQLLSGTNVLNVGYLDSTPLNSGNCNDINRMDAVMYTGWSKADMSGKNRWSTWRQGHIFRPNDTYYPYQSFFETLCNKVINRNPLPSTRDSIWQSIEVYGLEHYPLYGNVHVDPQNLTTRLRENPDAGYVKRYMPIISWPNEFLSYSQSVNFIDAAIITCNTISNIEALSGLRPETPIALLSAGYSHRQACFSHPRVCTFATTAEIDSLVTNNIPLFKSGAATSAIGWPNPLSASHRFSINRSLSASNGRFLSRQGTLASTWSQTEQREELYWPGRLPARGGDLNSNRVTPYTWGFTSDQALFATSVDATVTVGGYGLGGNKQAIFTNIIEFTNPVCAGGPGDSGALLYGLFNANSPTLSAWKIVGLHFAGSPTDLSREWTGINDIGYACRIDRVSELLSLSAWNGQQVRYTNLNNVKKVEIANRQSDVSIIRNGRKYWQTGFRPGNGTKTLPPSGSWTNPLVQPRPLSGHYLLYGTGTGFAWGESNEVQQMFNRFTLLRGEQWRSVYGNKGTIVFGISGNKQLFVNGNNIYATGVPKSAVGQYIYDWRNLPGRWDSVVSNGVASFARAGSRLFACGVNQNGQLGLGTSVTSDVETFTPVPGNWSSVATDGNVSFALSGNALFAAGLNTQGQLGLGHTWSTRSFTRVPGSWRKVVTGGFGTSTWLLSSNGSIFSIRLQTRTLPSAFVLVQRGNFTDIICGERGQVFALSGKRVWAYGSNTYGELGIGNTLRTNTFTLIPGNWDKISCGEYHSVALSGGRLFGAGQRYYSQLGVYDYNSNIDQFYTTHTQLSGTHWVDVNCAGNITYALRKQF
jgi:hypothetical protein